MFCEDDDALCRVVGYFLSYVIIVYYWYSLYGRFSRYLYEVPMFSTGLLDLYVFELDYGYYGYCVFLGEVEYYRVLI